MSTVKVRSKSELERAQKNRVDEIIVVGDLADKLRKAKKVTKMGKISLGVLAAAISSAAVTAPLTGGLSFAAAAPIAAMTGADIALIIGVSSIGLALVIAVFKGYDEVESGYGTDGPYIRLRKK